MAPSFFVISIWTRVCRPTLMRCHHHHHRARLCVRMTNTIRGVSRLNDTEKNSMDRRKDDMHESRNVVHPPVWRARRPELVQPAGATVALHEHSEVHAAMSG